MNKLLGIGFELAGHWIIEKNKLKCELLRHSSQTNILYVFVCDGQIKYVGKTVRTLAERMAGYRTPGKTQTTNINNHRRIKKLLAEGVVVEIFALPDNGLLHFGPFHINLAAALEDDIIRVIDPEWNGGVSEKLSSSSSLVAIEADLECDPVAPAVERFSFVLQPTYFRTGFFNVGVSSQHLLGGDGEKVELFLGDSVRPILGTINRRANANKAPRIMGGADLRDWFNANAAVSATILVDVLSPIAIRLRVAGGNN